MRARSLRPKRAIREHKPERLAGSCRCGLQPGHPGDCTPKEPTQEKP